jgi:quercetin dioxygenase-like cupin family protein
MKHPATIRKPGEGRRIGIVGDVYRFLATGEETDGKYATFEAIVPPGSGPPPHIHSREEESFLVLEGEMTFQLGEDRIVAGEGTFLNMPVGSLHCFKNESNRTARLLISVAPAGLEKMFFEVGKPLADAADTAPPPSQADIDKLLEAAPRYGVEIKVPH